MFVLAGCSKPFPKRTANDNASPQSRRQIESDSGAFQERATTGDRPLLYEVRWKRSSLTATDTQHMFTHVMDVDGVLYRNGRASSTFEADEAFADRSAGKLTLHGHVKMHQVQGQAHVAGSTLSCDRVAYAKADEIIKATGAVGISGPGYEMGGIEVVWCSNDLTEFASPELYVKTRHNSQAPKL